MWKNVHELLHSKNDFKTVCYAWSQFCKKSYIPVNRKKDWGDTPKILTVMTLGDETVGNF